MKKRKKDPVNNRICAKCGVKRNLQQHHLLPWTIFNDSATVWLCCDCHKAIHKEIGWKYMRRDFAQSKEFYLKIFIKWILTAGLILIMGYILIN